MSYASMKLLYEQTFEEEMRVALEWARRFDVMRGGKPTFKGTYLMASLVYMCEVITDRPNRVGKFMCTMAGAYNHEEAVRLLDSYRFGRRDMYLLVKNWSEEDFVPRIFDVVLLNKRYNVIQRAAAKGELETLIWLLLSGVSVDHRDSRGRSALHWAVMYNQIDIVKELLTWRPRLHILDYKCETPFDKAMKLGRRDIAELF